MHVQVVILPGNSTVYIWIFHCWYWWNHCCNRQRKGRIIAKHLNLCMICIMNWAYRTWQCKLKMLELLLLHFSPHSYWWMVMISLAYTHYLNFSNIHSRFMIYISHLHSPTCSSVLMVVDKWLNFSLLPLLSPCTSHILHRSLGCSYLLFSFSFVLESRFYVKFL